MNRSLLKSVVGVVITVVLALLPLVVLYKLLGERLFLSRFTAVFNGRLFTASWNRIHAGFTLDQPTIGKWYFWFTVFTVAGLSYMALVRRFCVRWSKLRHWIFVAGLTVLCLFLVCLLTIPFWWLIQYIHAMGWTPKRFYGLLYGISGYVVVFWFWYRTVKLKKMKDMNYSG